MHVIRFLSVLCQFSVKVLTQKCQVSKPELVNKASPTEKEKAALPQEIQLTLLQHLTQGEMKHP